LFVHRRALLHVVGHQACQDNHERRMVEAAGIECAGGAQARFRGRSFIRLGRTASHHTPSRATCGPGRS
jgi:hypothetical protein